jgi:P27 family predicted phage terminase small subunit
MHVQTVPPAPVYLSEDAKAKWDETWGLVDRSLVKTETHSELVAMYASACADWERCTRQINVSGLLLNQEGKLIENPLLGTRAKLEKVILECGQGLGLNRSTKDPAPESLAAMRGVSVEQVRRELMEDGDADTEHGGESPATERSADPANVG